MYAIIVATAVGVAVAALTSRDIGTAWGVVTGILALFVTQLVIGLVIKRRVEAVNVKVQAVMTAAQERINRRIQQFQRRPPGSPRVMQTLLEQEQDQAVREALTTLAESDRYRHWNVLLTKQLNTMRAMLYFQIRDFENTDKFLKNCLMFDARTIAIQMTRLYRRNELDALDRFFAKKRKSLKGDAAVLPFSLYAWVQLKQGNVQGALSTVTEAKKRSANPVLIENYERLANGRDKHFSNAGLGDEWYGLFLEEPKMKPQRVQARY